jgi:biopolymer transport protein ExbD
MSSASHPSDDSAISGINVTPLVDITLVLLIIFMVTARLITSQTLPMDLPKAATGSEQQAVFSLVLLPTGETLVDSQRVEEQDVARLARAAHAKGAEVRAVIQADVTVPHGRVIRMIDQLRLGGIGKIAFGVTSIPAATAESR